MTLSQKMRNMLLVVDKALEKGCTRAELMLTKELKVDDRVRMKCQLNSCGQYGLNRMCPPNVPDLAEASRILNHYTFALIMQITFPYLGADDMAAYIKRKNDFNKLVVELEKEAFRMGFTLATGLAGGFCSFCETCAGNGDGTSCRFPQQARPSMEALGMDVGAVCRGLGLPADFVAGEVTLTAALLID